MTGTTGRGNAQGELFAEVEQLRGDVKKLREAGTQLMAENENLERLLAESHPSEFDGLLGGGIDPRFSLIALVSFGLLLQLACPVSQSDATVTTPLLRMAFRTLMQIAFGFWTASVWKSHGISALLRGLLVWVLGWAITVAFISGCLHQGEAGVTSKVIEMSTPSEWWGVDRFDSNGSADPWVICVMLSFCADFVNGLTVTKAIVKFVRWVVQEIRNRRNRA